MTNSKRYIIYVGNQLILLIAQCVHICFKETEDTTNQQIIPYAEVDMSKKKKKKDDKQQKVHMYVSNQLKY